MAFCACSFWSYLIVVYDHWLITFCLVSIILPNLEKTASICSCGVPIGTSRIAIVDSGLLDDGGIGDVSDRWVLLIVISIALFRDLSEVKSIRMYLSLLWEIDLVLM